MSELKYAVDRCNEVLEKTFVFVRGGMSTYYIILLLNLSSAVRDRPRPNSIRVPVQAAGQPQQVQIAGGRARDLPVAGLSGVAC